MVAVGVAVVVSAAASVIWTRAQKRRLDPQRDVLDFGTIGEAQHPIRRVEKDRLLTAITADDRVEIGAVEHRHQRACFALQRDGEPENGEERW